MISLLFSITLCQAALRDVRIPAGPVDKAMTELSKVCNVAMDASPIFRNKVILINAHQVSDKELRDQIANTLDATWEWKENYWHLTQTSEQKKLEPQRQLKWRTRMVKKTIDHRLAIKESTAPFNRNFAETTYRQVEQGGYGGFLRMFDSGYGMPLQRLMTRFLKKFGPARIAAITPGHRKVFTFKPNQMQEAMGVDIQEDMRIFNEEQEIWRAVEKSKQKSTDTNAIESESATFSQLDTIYFTAYCDRQGQYSLSLFGYPADLNSLVFYTDANTYEGLFTELADEDLKRMNLPNKNLSQEAKDYRNLIMGNKKAVSKDRIDEVIRKALDPVTRDPLSIVPTESLLAKADEEKRNIVAILDDSMLYGLDQSIVTLGLIEKVKQYTAEFFEMDDKWIRIRSMPGADPSYPRKDLKNILQRVVKVGEVSLDDQAKMAIQQMHTGGYSEVTGMAMAFARRPNSVIGEIDAIRTYGYLSQAEFQAAQSKTGIPFSRLNAALQKHIFDTIFNSRQSSIQVINNPAKPSGAYFSSEPTNVAPFGIPPNAPFMVEVTSEPLVRMDEYEDQDGVHHGDTLSIFTWGQMKFYAEHPELQLGMTIDKSRRFHRVQKTEYKFQLLLSQEAAWRMTLHTFRSAGQESFSLDNLPQDLNPAFEAGYRKAAASKKGDGDGEQQDKSAP